MIESRGFSATWTRGPKRGPAANRNNGAKLAKGDWLAFIDDDCVADAGWLGAIRAAATRGDADVVEGRTTIPDKVDHPFRQGVENLTGDLYWSCNLAIRRDLFLEMGGFDEDFLEAGGEDMEFARRLRARAEIRKRFAPEAHVLHPVRVITWKGLVWRTRLVRWMSLYHLKTGESAPLDASGARVVWQMARDTAMNSLRTTWRCVRDLPRDEWKTRLFWQAWNLATIPVLFPYRVLWEFRFRRLMRERVAAAAAAGATPKSTPEKPC